MSESQLVTKENISEGIQRLERFQADIAHLPRLHHSIEQLITGERWQLEKWDEHTALLMEFVELVRQHEVWLETYDPGYGDVDISLHIDGKRVDHETDLRYFGLNIRPNYDIYIQETDTDEGGDIQRTTYRVKE